MMFRNLATGQVVTISDHANAIVLLIGPIFFLYNKIWFHAFVSAILVLITGGLAWIVYPFIVKRLIRGYYDKRGWIEVGEGVGYVSKNGSLSSDIYIMHGLPKGEYKALQKINVKSSKSTLFDPSPKVEVVNNMLRDMALQLGANAVVDVKYKKHSNASETLEASGLAIIDQSDLMKCPFCFETIKRGAKKCKHCGSMLEE